jgi:hypothetical protein
MPTSMDDLSPDYLGEDRIELTLNERIVAANMVVPGNTSYTTPVQPPPPDLRAFNLVTVFVYYDECLPEGVVLPLEMIVRGPSDGSYQRRIYSRIVPPILTFKPREGGPHFIMLREVAHNRWWGRININVWGTGLVPVSMP